VAGQRNAADGADVLAVVLHVGGPWGLLHLLVTGQLLCMLHAA
jgi:hypothetical protein